MSDPVQVFMENVCHLTGYLHRLLFLMKELDKKEHTINKMIEKKEEIYLEKLNDIHKKNSEKNFKYNNDESNIESNNESSNELSTKNTMEDIYKKKEGKEYIEYEHVKEKEDEETILSQVKNSNDFDMEKGKEKEKIKTEDEHINTNDNLQQSFSSSILRENTEKEKKENIYMNSCSNNSYLNYMKNKNLNQEESNGSNNSKKIKIKIDTKNEYNEGKKKENKCDTEFNEENEKRENSSDNISKDNFEKKKRDKRQNINGNNNDNKINKKIKIFDDTSNNECNNEQKENKENMYSTQNKDGDIPQKILEKTHFINSNDDNDKEAENEKDSNNFNEEELNYYLNEIMNDREQCMALLREKICINNQISFMIKHDYENLKKQYDKLYTEMEMTGESPPYLYNSHKNKNIPSELEDYNLNIRNKSNYSNYHCGIYNVDKQKTEENESFLSKSVSRKNLNKYNEYNTYTDKVKKSKKIKKNKIENGTSSKSLKNLNDKNNNQKMRISLFSAKNNYENKIRSSELNEISNKTEDKGKHEVNQINVDSSFNLSTECNINKKVNDKYLNDYSKGENKISYDSLNCGEKDQLQNISLNYTQCKNTKYDSFKPENNISCHDIYIKSNVEEDICPICNKGESFSSEFGMVGCDSCNKWFHFECVNYENNDCNESWFCPKCISVNESNTKIMLKKS